jgi:glycyl-tRNA synthetase beta subunit
MNLDGCVTCNLAIRECICYREDDEIRALIRKTKDDLPESTENYLVRDIKTFIEERVKLWKESVDFQQDIIDSLEEKQEKLKEINKQLVQQVQELVQEVEITKADFGGDMR